MGPQALPPGTCLAENQEHLDQFCDSARSEGAFAYDTEFVMEDRYVSDVCLIQLATSDRVLLVDPFEKLDLGPLWALLRSPEIETVVHAGQEDLALCFRETGEVPRRVFDVQIAAGLVGPDYPLSLQKLVQAVLHIRLHKSKTLTDWRKRPLHAAQLRYAAEDVSHLLPVRRKLGEQLMKLERTDWATEEFRAFEDSSLYARAVEDKLRRVKGVSTLKGQPLTVARQLFQWRDQIARQLNRPARVIMKDHLLVEVAKHGVMSFAELRELRGLNMSDRNIHALVDVVRQGQKLPAESWPATHESEFESPRESAMIALATAVVRSYCLDHDLAYSLVATKKSLRDVIRRRTSPSPSDESPELLSGWRAKTVGRQLDDVLAGRRSLHVEPKDGQLTVHASPRERPART